MWKKPGKTKEPSNAGKAYDYAVFLLSLNLRTVGEVRFKMQQRGYLSEIIDEVIGRLIGQKYLDDERYATVFLENLKTYKTFGFYGIKKKMIEKRLPPELIERVLTEGFSIADEEKVARRFFKKQDPVGVILRASASEPEESQYRSFAGAQDDAERTKKKKLAAKLKSRGFRGEVIARMVF